MSASRLDFDGIKQAALAACPRLLFSLLPGGRVQSGRFVVGNLQGDKGDSLSIRLHDGAWQDFATGEKGDLITLYGKVRGLTPGDAARGLASELAIPVRDVPRATQPAPVTDWHPIMPAPANATPPDLSRRDRGEPEHVAEVRDASGAKLHYIVRYAATRTEKKLIEPITFGTLKGVTGWHRKAPPQPRPLYGLPLPAGPVLVVEGEAKRDAAARLLPGHAVVSWPNGAQGIPRADWTPLHGRDVLIWPDNDGPGRDAAASIVNILRADAASLRIIPPPADAPEKWDAADAEREGWDTDRTAAHLYPPQPEPEPAPREDLPHDGDEWPFRCLGHDRGHYFILTSAGGQVLDFTPRDLSSHAELMTLAPLRWWEMAFPGKTSFQAAAAADAIIRACERVGIYDPDRLRGRGVWLDDGRTVLHLGQRSIVDGDVSRPGAFPSNFIYEAARPMEIALGQAADNHTASGLIRLCRAVSWADRDRDGRMLAGWIVCASLCGGMPWRPHLWLTSEAGAGKTWVMDNIIRPMLADLALVVSSKTSEAGIRQVLRLDSRPVIFDEAETQNDADRARMQQVLDLARVASAEDSPDIIKGGKDGSATRYRIRSCFAFSSINLGVTQAADESRVVVLNIAPHEASEAREQAFVDLKAMHAEVMKPGFPAALLARNLSLLPTIRANAATLAGAIARNGVSRRTGDTLGVLMAAAFSLTSRATLDADGAAAWLGERAWVAKAAKEREADPEWQRAMVRLVQTEVRFTNHNGRPETASVSELVGAVAQPGDRGIMASDADSALRRMGMRIVDGELRIANRGEGAARAFQGTPWASSWRATLARTPNARGDIATRFTPAHMDKSVAIPLDAIFGGEE